MKLIVIFAIFFNSYFLYSQKEYKIPVSFEKNGKVVAGAKYYLIAGQKAYLLKEVNNELVLDNVNINDDQKILMIDHGREVEFYIKPKKMFYLKITKKVKFKSFFQSTYIINQGFDDVEIAKSSNKKYILVE